MNCLLAVLTLSLLATGLFGSPISSTNVRPAPINPAPNGEVSVQAILDGMFGVGALDANSDQSVFGAWRSDSNTATATLAAEYSANSANHKFGIAFGAEIGSLFFVDLMLGPAASGSNATISFSGNTLHIGSSGIGSCGAIVNCGSFANPLVTQSFFSFYIDTGNHRYLTLDELNGGTVRALSYRQGAGASWAIAFEDFTDFDYNDLVVKIESINGAQVPEPASFLLIGFGMAGLFFIGRRRRGNS